MTTAFHTANTDTGLLVACLCAQWCGSCREYQTGFWQLQPEFPGARFLWIDIEDQADLVDAVDVENFPTLLISVDGQLRFFGALTPQQETLRRLVRATLQTPASIPFDPELILLARRLQDQPLQGTTS